MSLSKLPFSVGLFFFLVSVLTGCANPEASKAKYLERANKYMEEKNWPKARVALRNVLKIDPEDAGAYVLRAQVAEKENDHRNAILHYRKATELNPKQREAMVKLGWFYLQGNALDLVEAIAAKILTHYPDDAMGHAFKTAVLARKDQIDEAVAMAESLIDRYPEQAEVSSLLAGLYIRQERPRKAEKVLEAGLKFHPRHVALLNDLGITYYHLGKTGQAEAVFKKIIAFDPDVFAHHIRLVRFYIQNKQLDKAEQVLRKTVREEPSSELRRLVLAQFLNTQVGSQEGESFLLEARRDLPASEGIRFALGRLYEATRQFSKARAIYQKIVKEKKIRQAALSAQVRLVAIDMEEGKQDAAEARLKKVLEKNPRSSEALVLKGKMALALGDGKTVVQALRSVLRDQPELIEVHILLGRAYLGLGENDLARESLEKAVALNKRHRNARRFLARLDLAEGSRKRASERLDGILKDDPKDLEALKLLLTLHVLERAWPKAHASLARMRSAGMDPFRADLAEGELYQASKKWKKAVAAFERAAVLQPEAMEPLRGWVQVYLRQDRKDEAVGRLQRIISGDPDHPYAHGFLGEILLIHEDLPGAEKESKLASRVNPGWFVPWRNWAKVKLAQDKPLEAVTVLEKGVQTNPESFELRMLLASMLEQTDQVDRAIEAYERVLKEHPKAAAAANNLAFLLADRKGDPRSLEKALALSRDFDERNANPPYLDTLAWVYVKMGQGEMALRLLKEVVGKVPGQPLFDYHLGVAYLETGDRDQAKTHLAKAVKSGKPFSGFETAGSLLKEMDQ